MIARSVCAASRQVTFYGVLLVLLVLAGCNRPLPFPTPGHELVVLTTPGPLTYAATASTDEAGETQFQASGLEYDLSKAFADYLETGVRFEVVAPEDLPKALQRHRGHFAAAWLTEIVDQDFVAGPKIAESYDVLVQHQDSLPIRRMDQLAGKTIHVLSGSRQHQALLKRQSEVPGMKIEAVEGGLPLKLLERLSERKIDLVLLDSATVSVGLNYYPTLDTVFRVGKPYEIRWQFPADGNPEVLEQAKTFIESARRSGALKRITDRYLGHLDRLGQVDNTVLLSKMKTVLPSLREYFIDAELESGIDWRLLAALAYQESAWDPLATSYTNVRGIMMLTEDTADRLGVTNRLDSRQSILAGARYLSTLKQQLPSSVLEPDRIWLALAAYNIGPGSLSGARSFAQKNGLNPNNWFDMKKALPMYAQVSSARGGEAVVMVENIRVMYSTLQRFEPPYVPRVSLFEVVTGHKKKKAPTREAPKKKQKK